MDFRKIHSSEIDALWDLQKQYKAEIGEEEPDSEGKVRMSLRCSGGPAIPSRTPGNGAR